MVKKCCSITNAGNKQCFPWTDTMFQNITLCFSRQKYKQQLFHKRLTCRNSKMQVLKDSECTLMYEHIGVPMTRYVLQLFWNSVNLYLKVMKYKVHICIYVYSKISAIYLQILLILPFSFTFLKYISIARTSNPQLTIALFSIWHYNGGCLATGRHLSFLQHLTVTSSLFAHFTTSFQQAESMEKLAIKSWSHDTLLSEPQWLVSQPQMKWGHMSLQAHDVLMAMLLSNRVASSICVVKQGRYSYLQSFRYLCIFQWICK